MGRQGRLSGFAWQVERRFVEYDYKYCDRCKYYKDHICKLDGERVSEVHFCNSFKYLGRRNRPRNSECITYKNGKIVETKATNKNEKIMAWKEKSKKSKNSKKIKTSQDISTNKKDKKVCKKESNVGINEIVSEFDIIILENLKNGQKKRYSLREKNRFSLYLKENAIGLKCNDIIKIDDKEFIITSIIKGDKNYFNRDISINL